MSNRLQQRYFAKRPLEATGAVDGKDLPKTAHVARNGQATVLDTEKHIGEIAKEINRLNIKGPLSL